MQGVSQMSGSYLIGTFDINTAVFLFFLSQLAPRVAGALAHV